MCWTTKAQLAWLRLETCRVCGSRVSLQVAGVDYVQVTFGGANGPRLHVHVGALGLHLFPPDFDHVRTFLTFAQMSWTPRWREPIE